MTGPDSTMRHDLEGIRRAGTKIDHAGADLGALRDVLVSALDASGECWGSDEAGQNFAQSYVPSADGCRSALTNLVDALQKIGENLHRTATDSEQRDQQQARELGSASS